ncbi:hypothetical protein P3X46_021419 [Hevea brasiliensis]|uniref:C3H1-type domain-containing protein n=1 Tax=Hevea brasiliensis TaxID=3981 RepID=A0ABQ9LFH9_HEVBR|nr:uncharacterized protein At1g21580 isoform X2 [Hevea brasiliensis]KAJ9166712.1 hypothetical protein P3X46_021419 [Hevea brasiliensis]
MDPRSPYLHHTRYVPRHPQPPPPPPQSHPHPDHPFPNNPNIYASHHSTLIAAPPPPPLRPQPRPPPTPSYHSLPTPPQFNPHDSQFSYNPNTFNSNHPRSHPDVHNFTQSPPLMHHKPFDDDLPRRLPDYIRDSRPDLRDPPRVLPDRWPSRPYPPANVDSDSYRRPLDNQPMSPMKIRRELEGNSRFIEEHKQREELRLGRGDDNYHRRSQFGSTSDRSSRDFRMVSNQMNQSSPCENLRGLPYDNRMNENQRWVHGREVNGDAHYSFIERGSNEIGDPSEIRVATGKREHYRCREVNAQLERHSSKGSREDSYEFSRTSRKPLQKKSVLLRIQKPNYRNREDERVHYLGYLDDNKSSSFRGKDQNLYQNHEMGEQVREGSPVELDVSFKSNSLVAKAIATPSSTGVSDLHLTPKNEKVRKVVGLNKDSSSSSAIKPNEGIVKLENAVLVANNASSSDMDLLQSKVEVTASVTGNVQVSGSLPGSSGTKTSPGNSKVESSTKVSVSNKGGTNVISGKTSSLKVAKKKKIVKRVVKKVINPLSSSSSQPTTKCDGSVTAYGVAHGLPASSEPEKSSALVSVDIVDSQPHLNETNVVPETENDRVEGFAKVLESDNDTITDSSGLRLPNIKRKRSHSTSPLGSSSHEESKINGNLANGNSANYLHGMSSTDKDFSKLLNENTSSDMDSVEPASKQLCLDGGSFLLENNTASLSPKVLGMETNSAEGNTDFGFLSSDEIKIHEGPASSYNITLGCDSDSGLISDGITVSNIGTTDVSCKEPCTNQGKPLAENGVVDQCLNANFSVGSGKIFCESNSGERTIQNVDTCASCSNEVRTIYSSNSGHIISGEIDFSSNGTIDDVCGRPSSDKVSTLENVPTGGSLNCTISTDGSKEDTPNIKKSNKNVEMPQLHVSKSEVNNSYLKPVNMVNSATWVDTTLRLSFEDPTPTEFTVSGDVCGNVGLRGCTDGISDFCLRSSPDALEANASGNSTVNVGPSGTSKQNQKKRKFSGSQLESTCLIASGESEGPLTAGISVSAVEVPCNSGSGLMQPEPETTVSAMNPLFTSDFPPLKKQITEPLDNCSVGGYHGTEDSLIDGFEDSGLRGVHSCSTVWELAVQKVQSPCPSGSEGKQIAEATLVMAGSSHQNNSILIESGEAEKMDVDAGEEQDIADSGTAQCQFPSELQVPDSDERLPGTDVENDSCQHIKNDLPSMSSYSSSLGDGKEVSATNSSGAVMGLVSDTLPDMLSTSHIQLSIEKGGGDDEILLGKRAIKGGSNISVVTSGSPNTEINFNSDHGVENDHSFSGKTGLLPSQDSINSTQMGNTMSGEVYGRKNQPNQAVSRIYPGRSSVVFASSKNTASSTHISKPRTWHRADNSSTFGQPGNKAFSSTVPTQRKLHKQITKFENTSYIRKGNSLVRKPTTMAAQSQSSHGLSSSVYRLNSLGTDEVKKNAGSDIRTGVVDPSNFVRTGANAAFERPRTPPLASATKLPNHASSFLGNSTSSPLAEPLHNCATETASDHMTSTASNDVLNSSENAIIISENPMTQTGQINNLDCHNELNDGNALSSNANSVTYVKRKSNQLVATSNPSSLSVYNAHNAPALPSDGYYKRRKNQLVRTSLESHVQPAFIMPEESVNPEGQAPHNITSSRSSSKRRSRKAVTKTHKPSKFALVWTQRSAQLLNDDDDSLHRHKFLPHLFPWKRATYWRSFITNSAANPSNNSSSAIRKLLLSRKRDTVYTRSKHGFSLRKSKVLSVGGSSLKWSKSIERRSKKASEEATLAVAEAERKKREQSGASCVVSGTMNRNSSSRKSVPSINLHSGERIFQIGSFRYKMDSSRRTLQRISDDDSSYSAAFQTEKDFKRSYVPRRLVIGKDEYVRIGNGNQLVRDPKKRTRILASEKVRWSLHTARSRLARKRKYCQFFTRFGKCNKDDGKCPYIHDSSKIAVCTKFLNGLCFNSDCKLTHKVIPERMPDCSYYLQGLCTNKNCPYRHVHVNPNAFTCEGFLRGYCADGNECRKKHSYVCPTYEATGSCPQGSKCKLHHPKNRSKGKKSKQSREKKIDQGRYFGSTHINVSEPGTAVSETHSAQDNSKICFEGSIADYMILDVADAVRENINLADEQTSFSEGDPLDLKLVDPDELIKPIRIMTT